jgi:hypothetical protein
MDESLALAAANVQVSEDVFIDGVVVPFVVRSQLKYPLRQARIRTARENRGGPLVVARPLIGVPCARIGSAVIDEVQIGIVADPPPRRRPAVLPLIALPALDAEIGFADRLAHHQRRLRVDEHVLVGAGTIGAPYYAPILNTVGCERSAHPVFSAGVAYDDLVAHDER